MKNSLKRSLCMRTRMVHNESRSSVVRERTLKVRLVVLYKKLGDICHMNFKINIFTDFFFNLNKLKNIFVKI